MAKPTRATNVDWKQVRKEYISDSTVSLATLAKKYGVSERRIETMSSREEWGKHRARIGEKAMIKWEDKLIEEKAQAPMRHLQHFRNLQALASKAIMEMDKRNILTDRQGNAITFDGQPVMAAIDPFSLAKLASAMKTAIDGERVTLGLPTSVNGLTDGKGGDVWTGLAELAKEAQAVAKNAANKGS